MIRFQCVCLFDLYTDHMVYLLCLCSRVLQVMASDEHRFLSSSLYSTGVLVAWDPAPFSADLTQVMHSQKTNHTFDIKLVT